MDKREIKLSTTTNGMEPNEWETINFSFEEGTNYIATSGEKNYQATYICDYEKS